MEKSASLPRSLPSQRPAFIFCTCLSGCDPSNSIFRCRHVAVACSFVCHPVRDLLLLLPLSFKLSSRKAKPQPTQTTRPKPCSPSVTIHHLPLDANPDTFYSLRIFDTLAPLANPIAVTKRTLCAATKPRPHLIQSSESFCLVFNPVPPDGGQHSY